MLGSYSLGLLLIAEPYILIGLSWCWDCYLFLNKGVIHIPLQSLSEGLLIAMIMVLLNLVEMFLFIKNMSHWKMILPLLMFGIICILPRESLRGLIRLNLLGVDWTSFLFLEICCHLALNVTSPLSDFRSWFRFSCFWPPHWDQTNNSLLKDKDFCMSIENLIDCH